LLVTGHFTVIRYHFANFNISYFNSEWEGPENLIRQSKLQCVSVCTDMSVTSTFSNPGHRPWAINCPTSCLHCSSHRHHVSGHFGTSIQILHYAVAICEVRWHGKEAKLKTALFTWSHSSEIERQKRETNVKLSLFLINEALWHDDIWGSADIALFLTSELDEGMWSASSPGKEIHASNGSEAAWAPERTERCGDEKNLVPAENQTPVVKLTARSSTDWTTSSPKREKGSLGNRGRKGHFIVTWSFQGNVQRRQ
jgi:hypothetical protein